MNIFCRLLTLGVISVMASLSAQAETPSDSAAAAAPKALPPIPTLHCDFNAMAACMPDGTCEEGKELGGIKIPVRVTVDFENSVVGAVDENGYARTDKFDGVAESAEQLIMHGIDGAFGWLLLIDKNSNKASMSFATADTTLSGFGTCTNK
jgi:hypothetical protein